MYTQAASCLPFLKLFVYKITVCTSLSYSNSCALCPRVYATSKQLRVVYFQSQLRTNIFSSSRLEGYSPSKDCEGSSPFSAVLPLRAERTILIPSSSSSSLGALKGIQEPICLQRSNRTTLTALLLASFFQQYYSIPEASFTAFMGSGHLEPRWFGSSQLKIPKLSRGFFYGFWSEAVLPAERMFLGFLRYLS